MSIAENLETIHEHIENDCRSRHADNGPVKLVAVSKYHTVDEIKEAYRDGQRAFGENRVQELLPKIDALAREGDPSAIAFPRAKLDEPLNFSFSGLKSAVLNYLNQAEMKGETIDRANVAASFQEAVVDVLASHTAQAMQEHDIHTLLLAGGVSANSRIRARFEQLCTDAGYALYYPPLSLCTDNAAMIGAAAAYKYDRNEFAGYDLNAVAQLPFSEYVINMKQ